MKLYVTEEERAADMPQKTNKVSCLGPEESYSFLAAEALCKELEIVPCPSFAESVAALLRGETDYVVLPVENAINGGIVPVLDLLAEAEIFGDEEYLLPIDHRLAVLEGVKYEDIEAICSHEQALSQCAGSLRRTFPNATLLATPSTAESLRRLDGHTAGIVGAHVNMKGVVLSQENIADNKTNFTRFLRLRRGEPSYEKQSAMVFLCAVCAHKPGSLLGLLKIFQRYSLNLTRIESRPLKDSYGVYRFFIEFAGDISSARVRSAITDASYYCAEFKLIGAYM